MKTYCPYCQTPAIHSAEFINKRVACPKCKKQFIIPSPQVVKKVAVDDSPATKNHGLLALSILGGIGFLCLASCGTLGFLLLRDKEPKTEPQTVAASQSPPRSSPPFQRFAPPVQPQGAPPTQQEPPTAPAVEAAPQTPQPRVGGNKLDDLKAQVERDRKNPLKATAHARDFLAIDSGGYADGSVVLDFFHKERRAYAKLIEDISTTGRLREGEARAAMNRIIYAFKGTPVKFQATIRSAYNRRASVVRGGRTVPAMAWTMVVSIKSWPDESPDEIHISLESEDTFSVGEGILVKGQFQNLTGVTERAFHEKPLWILLSDQKIEKMPPLQAKVEPAATQPGTPSAPADQAVKLPNRMPEDSEEDLRKQLLAGVPEVGLNQEMDLMLYGIITPPRTTSSPFRRRSATTTAAPPQVAPDFGPQFFTRLARSKNRSEFATLPWRSFPDCQLGKELAENLNDLSLRLRDCLRKATPAGQVRPDAATLKQLLATPSPVGRIGSLVTSRPAEWKTKAAIPALMQLLQVENAPVRSALVELLSDIPGKEASRALAKRALFDLSEELRRKAVQALSKRPTQEYEE